MPVRSRRGSAALAVAVTVTGCLAVAAIPASPAFGDDVQRARAPQTVQVKGMLRLTDATTGEYAVTGDLVGKWTIPPTKAYDYYSTSTTIIQRGTESFRGCLVRGARRCGTLSSEYISWTYLEPGGRLIEGGCTHAPTGGTRGFRGVRGLIQMTDTPNGDEVATVYDGIVILDAKPEERSTSVTTAPAAPAAGTVVSTLASSC